MTLVTNAQRDPTRTAGLRREYTVATRKRFNAVRKIIRETVSDNDALSLGPPPRLKLHARAATRYNFPSDPAGKSQAFMDWLREAADEEILEVTQREGQRITLRNEWQNAYVRAAYTRGVDMADAALRRGGVLVPDYQIWAVFQQPVHANALALLFTRNFDELRGITEAMGQAIARELSLGMAKGLGPAQIGRLLSKQVDGIGVRRGILLARTEIIRAHAESTLNRFEEMGLEHVTGEVEFRTAGDQRVCPICKELAGRTYTIAEARGVIPVHPQCRCAWLPVILATQSRRIWALARQRAGHYLRCVDSPFDGR